MRRVLVMLPVVLVLWAALPALARDPAPGAYLEKVSGGRIDWEAGVVYATGLGVPPRGARSAAEARAMAARAATVVARRNLLEVIKGVQVDSTTTVENFMVVSDTVVNEVQGFLQNSVVQDATYLSDGAVEVTVAVPLRGALAGAIIPPAIPFAPRSSAPPAAPVEPKPIPEAVRPETPAAPAPPTGLLVDAKGLGARPAMTPRILDQSGREVFGSALVSREFAIQQGMAGYAKDPAAAAANPRVGGNPLKVKALAVQGPSGADLVIADADAARVREAEAAAKFLEKCRVMIVLD
ncbi:MAG: hypothetical protein AB1916_06295 [Thermodesulfobacteriota bacterium]